jgi:hypothetical protein
MSKSKAQNATTEPEKTDLFDRVAAAFGFENTDTGRKPRFRYDELTVVYDRLQDLGYISVSRDGSEVRADLRGEVADALGFDRRGGRPTTKEELQELVGILLDGDVVPDGGSASGITRPAPGESYPTDRDLEQVEALGLVQAWDDPEECVCVSRRQNATRYHTLWTVRDGELVPACKGYSPSNETPHRLAPEESIARTKDECDYCKNEDLRL